MIFCCPACGGALERRESALVCQKGHSFDVARQGYVHLLPVKQMHAKVPGDTKQMVDARRRFLALGHYDAFRDTLRRLVSEHLPQGGTVLDAGCGEGFYTAALAEAALEKNGRTAGIDISKFAVKAAAGRHKGIDFAVASLFHIPCAAESPALWHMMFSKPRASISWRKSPSAIGLLHVLPVQTNSIFIFLFDLLLW